MIWIGDNLALQNQLLEALHCSTVGHSGIPVTYHKIKQLFCLVRYEECHPCLCQDLYNLPADQTK
jgi:hypothetical protein